VLITFIPKLWSTLSSYVSFKSCSLRNVAIKSFPYVVTKCIIDAITVGVVTTNVATKSIKLESINELKYSNELTTTLILR
jgi:hypothetical protein